MQTDLSANLDGNARSSGNLDQRVRQEQYRLLASHLPVVLPGSLLIAVLLVWGFWDSSDQTASLIWLGILLAVISARLGFSGYFSRQPENAARDRTLRNALLIGSFVSGCVWGSAGILFFDPENAYGFALLVIVLGGLVAGSLGAHSYYLPNFVLFAVPEFSPLMGELFLLGSEFYLMTGVMMALFLMLNLFYAKKYADMTEHSIRLQFVNDALLEQLRASNRELHKYSYTDSLTGIGNRRQFDLDFEQTWQVAVATQVPVCLILMDVDHFKEYNDTYGHPQGDEVLKGLALVLLKVCEEYKVRGRPMRIGGEEFALLLKGDLELASSTAETIREAVGNIKIDSHRGRAVTVSLGLAMAHPADGDVRETLFDAADKALYKAKTAGRNRVIAA